MSNQSYELLYQHYEAVFKIMIIECGLDDTYECSVLKNILSTCCKDMMEVHKITYRGLQDFNT